MLLDELVRLVKLLTELLDFPIHHFFARLGQELLVLHLANLVPCLEHLLPQLLNYAPLHGCLLFVHDDFVLEFLVLSPQVVGFLLVKLDLSLQVVYLVDQAIFLLVFLLNTLL